MWLYLSSLFIFGVVLVILCGRRRGGVLGSAHAGVVRLSSSIASNVVPVGYCVALLFFLRLFDRDFLIPFSGYSSAHIHFIRASYSLPFLSMARLYTSDPGYISRINHSAMEAVFPYDKIIFFPFKECRTCHFTKPARSKHCSVCNRCVAMQDHHCLWTNNCIGLHNFRWFFLFLMVNLYIFGYGLLLLTIPLINNAFSAWKNPDKGFWFWSLVRSGEAQRVGVCLWILCAAILPLVCIFIVYHLRYIWAGVTTNEADKWEDIKALLADGALYIYKPGTSILLQKQSNGKWHRTLSTEEQALVYRNSAQLVQATSIEDIPNIYDRGFLNNLMLLLSASTY